MSRNVSHDVLRSLVTAAAAFMVAFALSQTAFAKFPSASFVTSEPTLPLTGFGSYVHVTIRTVGAPVAVDQISATVQDGRIEVVHCLRQSSSSTAPAAVSYKVAIGPLPEGTYPLVVTQKYLGEDGSPCGRSGVLLESQVVVVADSAMRTVIEYYYAPGDHYFLTQDAAEIAALDGGQFSGWTRTGQQFVAYGPGNAAMSSKLRPTCRYYGRPEAGLDTHFLSSSATECASIPVSFPNQWIEETPDAFGVATILGETEACPTGTLPVYRLFNNRSDVNHRYTTSVAIRQQMLHAGWISEGLGPLGVVMCAEAPF